MTGSGAERRALQPLWMLATGTTVGAIAAMALSLPERYALPTVAAGAVVLVAALARPRWRLLWLAAGVAIAIGRGLGPAADRAQLVASSADDAPAVRLIATIEDGWVPTRWGQQATVTVRSAQRGRSPIRLTGRWRLEVRGTRSARSLPAPGCTVNALAEVRGGEDLPFLVVSSARLVETMTEPRGLPALRHSLAAAVLTAAGTDVARIRSAELAAALVLGRRDLLTRERREGWRRSGLAHLLAVSGLHVGLVTGMLWLALRAVGLHPRRVRWVLLVSIPSYALLAGGSPSAMRAAAMAAVYLGGRQLGRAVLPMASVLLASSALVAAAPGLVADAGFQLTVLVTAALVRWVPAASAALPGPRRLAAMVAVPFVAQAAAAPIAAVHFRTAVPGAVAANLLVPVLLSPTLASAVVAVALAPVWPNGARPLLDLVGLGERAMWLCGGPGRALELVLPPTPPVVVVALVAAGWLALQPGRQGSVGVAAWSAALLVAGSWWLLVPPSRTPRVELLEVADGLAATVTAADGVVVVDGGRWRRQAAELLADGRHRRLVAVVASHPDEDHIGGLDRVIGALDVDRLVVPSWARASPDMVPLLRTARRRGTRVVAVARGSLLRVGDTRVLVLWPPAALRSGSDNDRSLVLQVDGDGGSVFVGADIDRAVEHRLARSGELRSAVLVVPHHGSRGSCSDALIDAVAPEVALIPAGPLNRHHHPHQEVVERLKRRGIPFRAPIRHGRCGAAFLDGSWQAYPLACAD